MGWDGTERNGTERNGMERNGTERNGTFLSFVWEVPRFHRFTRNCNYNVFLSPVDRRSQFGILLSPRINTLVLSRCYGSVGNRAQIDLSGLRDDQDLPGKSPLPSFPFPAVAFLLEADALIEERTDGQRA